MGEKQQGSNLPPRTLERTDSDIMGFYRPGAACRTRPFCHASAMHPIFAWLTHGMDWAYILVFFVGFGLIGTFLWVAALVSCLRNETADNKMIVWVLVILVTHCIGG